MKQKHSHKTKKLKKPGRVALGVLGVLMMLITGLSMVKPAVALSDDAPDSSAGPDPTETTNGVTTEVNSGDEMQPILTTNTTVTTDEQKDGASPDSTETTESSGTTEETQTGEEANTPSEENNETAGTTDETDTSAAADTEPSSQEASSEEVISAAKSNNVMRAPEASAPDPLVIKPTISKYQYRDPSTDTWPTLTADNAASIIFTANTELKATYILETYVYEISSYGNAAVFTADPWVVMKSSNNNQPITDLNKNEIGTMSVEDANKIKLSFNDDWVSSNKDQKVSITAVLDFTVDWTQRDKDNTITLPLDGSSFKVSFQDDMEARYGDMTVTKELVSSTPELRADGHYYLKYRLTVSTPSTNSYTIPDVSIVDFFKQNAKYVSSFDGIPKKETSTADLTKVLSYESTAGEGTAGTVYVTGNASTETNPIPEANETISATPGTLVWKLGNLNAGEKRALTYSVQLTDDYLLNNTWYNHAEQLLNTAASYAKTYPREAKQAIFTPRFQAAIKKSAGNVTTNADGSVTIPYTVTVTADANNSRTIPTITFKDRLSESSDIASYVTGSFHLYKGTTASAENEIDSSKVTVAISSNTFNVSFGEPLANGESLTLTYNVTVTPQIFVRSQQNMGLTNYASARLTADAAHDLSNTYTSQKNLGAKKWDRKIAGAALTAETTVSMSDGSKYPNDSSTATDTNFTVPAGSIQYRVLVNEEGSIRGFNASGATMTDTLNTSYLQYVGYVRIDQYSGASGTVGMNDTNALNTVASGTPEKTVWYKIDGLTTFSLTPKSAGLDDASKAYVLTYYAKPVNTGSITTANVTNSFVLRGNIVGPNEASYTLPNQSVTANAVISGTASFTAEKDGWYYSRSTQTQPDDGIYSDDHKLTSADGALYWSIVASGTTITDGYTITDKPPTGEKGDSYGSNADSTIYQVLPLNAVAAVFKGPVNQIAAALQMSDLSQVIAQKDALQLVSLPGTVYGANTSVSLSSSNDPYWTWTPSGTIYANGSEQGKIWNNIQSSTKGVFTFKKDLNLQSGEAVMIVLRTTPLWSTASPMNGDSKDAVRTYRNRITYASSSISTGTTVEGTYFLSNTAGLKKDSLGAFVVNGNNKYAIKQVDGTLSTSAPHEWAKDNEDKTYYLKQGLGSGDISIITKPGNSGTASGDGTYVAWELTANHDEQISGDVTISDTLPEGLDLAYIRYWKFGSSYDLTNYPKTATIAELETESAKSDSVWKKYTFTANVEKQSAYDSQQIKKPNYQSNTITYYYNTSTREIRMKLTGLKKASADTDKYFASFLMVTKVSNTDALQSNNEVVLGNTATMTASDGSTYSSSASQSIRRRTLEKKFTGTAADTDTYTTIRAPFTITVNPYAENLNQQDGGMVTLEDHMGSNLSLDSSSIKMNVTKIPSSDSSSNYKVGEPLDTSEYTITVSESADGSKVITMTVPDELGLEISYVANVNVPPNGPAVTISNDVVWKGYAVQKSVTSGVSQAYAFRGAVTATTSTKPLISVRKLDANHVNGAALAGATFQLTEVTMDANGNVTKEGNSWTGTTSGGVSDSSLYSFDWYPNTSMNEKHKVYTSKSDASVQARVNDLGFLTFDSNISSDAEGIVAADLEYGKIYRLQETQAPEGYVLNSTPVYIMFLQPDSSGNVTIPDGTPSNVRIWSSGTSYLQDAYNQKGVITVNKRFRTYDSDADATPAAGTYTFGLYSYDDGQVGQLLKTATAKYETDPNTKAVKLTDTAVFSDLDFGKTYVVRELDENRIPLENMDRFKLNDLTYMVEYDQFSGVVTIDAKNPSQSVTVTNVLPFYVLPKTGGSGTHWMYLTGAALIGAAVLLNYWRRHAKRRT